MTWREIPGNFTFPQFYYALARMAGVQHVVEVGVNYGQSAAYLAEQFDELCCVNARIDLVDIGLERVGAHLDYVTHRIGARHRGASLDVARSYGEHSVDAVFIDADHEFGPVQADIAAWRGKVRRGGVIGGHDFCNQYPGVIQAVTEAFPEYRVMRCSMWANGQIVESGGDYFPCWYVEV
jgi:predicted O-methyltransferase YrrM